MELSFFTIRTDSKDEVMKFAQTLLLSAAFATPIPAVFAQPVSGPTAPIDAAARKQVVESAIRELNERYVFPDVAKQVEVVLNRSLQAKNYETLNDAQKFAEQLTNDIQGVTKDKHIRVRYSAQPIPERVRNEPSAEELAEYRKQAAMRNYGVEKVERLPLNVGYIELRGFESAELAGEAIAAAMTLMANTEALIVDLRRNGGGDPATVALMTSYLFDERTHLNSFYKREGNRTTQFWTQDWVPGKRFGKTKPVYVLTSKRTFSGAEEFSYNLKNLKRGTVVGETTGGGAHPGGMRRLAANFSMFVPDGRAINPITNTNWEGVGVEPDVKVPADDALRTAQILALKKIQEKGGKEADYLKFLQDRVAELEKTAPKS
jgi:retinol-binding protein 3